jgi:hypothetical protein
MKQKPDMNISIFQPPGSVESAEVTDLKGEDTHPRPHSNIVSRSKQRAIQSQRVVQPQHSALNRTNRIGAATQVPPAEDPAALSKPMRFMNPRRLREGNVFALCIALAGGVEV